MNILQLKLALIIIIFKIYIVYKTLFQLTNRNRKLQKEGINVESRKCHSPTSLHLDYVILTIDRKLESDFVYSALF